ncbi:9025_t:CDS:2, partial [Dentiscutata heterogama]
VVSYGFFKDEEKGKDIKFVIKDQLIKQKELYSNILGYNINYLITVLSYLNQICLIEYWFYSSEYAQLASDIFNIPVTVFVWTQPYYTSSTQAKQESLASILKPTIFANLQLL